MRYTVYLEIEEDGTTMAHVPALPGCTSTGLTQEVALARVPDAIAGYNAWLRAHGEQAVPATEPVEVVIGGSTEDADNHLGDESGLLPSDSTPLSEADVATLMRLMSYSRSDLLSLVQGLSRDLLRWQPSAQSEQAGWCIDDILEHIARAERVYTSRLDSNIFDLVESARHDAIERMSRLTATERSQMTQHQGEFWTARKVFRRFLEHELEHQQHIQQILHSYQADQGL